MSDVASISPRERWERRLAEAEESAAMGTAAAEAMAEALRVEVRADSDEGAFVPSRRALRTLRKASSRAEQAADAYKEIGRLVERAVEQL